LPWRSLAGWRATTHAAGAARGLVAAMFLYNVAVAALLAFAGVGLGLRGIALWPAVILHAAMAVWCVPCLLFAPKPT
jgi:small basic protein